MHVIFIHGPAASGKHTIGARLSEETGLPLFHNHLAVDAAKALFDFGSAPFNTMRATIWRTAFSQAAAAGRSFIFTFHPEASVEPQLIDELTRIVEECGGRVFFVELTCSRQTILERLDNQPRPIRQAHRPGTLSEIEAKGGFEFPALPSPLVTIDTDKTTPDEAARTIAAAIRAEKQ